MTMFNFKDDIIEDMHMSEIKLARVLKKITNWLEEEVKEGEQVTQAYDDLSEATYPNDVYHIGRHACAKQLLTQINKWEVGIE